MQNRFLNDNRSDVLDANEWIDYVDDYPDELLTKNLKNLHGGFWYDGGYLDLSDEGLNNIRETLKHYKGGKLKNGKFLGIKRKSNVL